MPNCSFDRRNVRHSGVQQSGFRCRVRTSNLDLGVALTAMKRKVAFRNGETTVWSMTRHESMLSNIYLGGGLLDAKLQIANATTPITNVLTI